MMWRSCKDLWLHCRGLWTSQPQAQVQHADLGSLTMSAEAADSRHKAHNKLCPGIRQTGALDTVSAGQPHSVLAHSLARQEGLTWRRARWAQAARRASCRLSCTTQQVRRRLSM